MSAPAPDTPADRLLAEYDGGRLNRRELAARLMALGAAAALARTATADDADAKPDPPLFRGRNIDHVALSVSDVGRSVKFYTEHLGLRKLRGSDRQAFLGGDDGFFLALFQTEDAGLNHFCFGIDGYEADAAAERLRAAGREVRQTEGRVYFKDPDGIEVQLAARRSL